MEFPQFEFVWYFSDDWASGFGGWVGVDQRDKLPPVSSYHIKHAYPYGLSLLMLTLIS